MTEVWNTETYVALNKYEKAELNLIIIGLRRFRKSYLY